MEVRARHQQKLMRAVVRNVSRSGSADLVTVEMEEDMFAPAEGQAMSFYMGAVCMGGGEIRRVLDRDEYEIVQNLERATSAEEILARACVHR